MYLSDLDTSKITFSEPKHQKGRATTVWLNYEEGPMPLVQTWLGRAGYNGISAFPNPDTGKMQYSLELTLGGGADEAANEMIANCRRRIEEFDEFLVKSAVANSKQWFKKKLEFAVCKEFNTPWLRIPKDRDTGEPTDRWPPTIRLKLPTNEEDTDFRFALYNIHTEERIPAPSNLPDYVPKGSLVRAILKCGGMWIANGRFGCTWYVEQLQVAPTARLTTCAFRRTGEERGLAAEVEEVDLDAGKGRASRMGGGSDDGEEVESDVVESDGE